MAPQEAVWVGGRTCTLEPLWLFLPLGSHHLFTNPRLGWDEGQEAQRSSRASKQRSPRGHSHQALPPQPSQALLTNLALILRVCMGNSRRAEAREAECRQKDRAPEDGGGVRKTGLGQLLWQSGEGVGTCHSECTGRKCRVTKGEGNRVARFLRGLSMPLRERWFGVLGASQGPRGRGRAERGEGRRQEVGGEESRERRGEERGGKEERRVGVGGVPKREKRFKSWLHDLGQNTAPLSQFSWDTDTHQVGRKLYVV